MPETPFGGVVALFFASFYLSLNKTKTRSASPLFSIDIAY